MIHLLSVCYHFSGNEGFLAGGKVDYEQLFHVQSMCYHLSHGVCLGGKVMCAQNNNMIQLFFNSSQSVGVPLTLVCHD